MAPDSIDSLCWIRRDLRLHDHRALFDATQNSKRVAVVFVFDTTILSKLEHKDDRRISFIFESLKEIHRELEQNGSQLITLHGDPKEEIPKLASRLKVHSIYANEDYEPRAMDRDESIKSTLTKQSIHFFLSKDQVIFSGTEIKKADGKPYQVYTPYSKAWLEKLEKLENSSENPIQEFRPNLKKLWKRTELPQFENLLDLKKLGFEPQSLWIKPGTLAGTVRLKEFENQISSYDESRNIPSLPQGTSGLSVHLRFGTLSVRELVRRARKHNSEGARVWLKEIIWRDFFFQILYHFPYVVRGAFQKKYENIQWPGTEKHFRAWCEGRTGYPIVDAAMRHFNQSGWMHNRLRMIVASFLVKDLLVDWRKGERYFAQNLLDYDLALNNGNWQWAASTGCDAQPYFRIFNPESQSERFDPKAHFILKILPELNGLSPKEIHHLPSQKQRPLGLQYPDPIVSHDAQRLKALELFKRA